MINLPMVVQDACLGTLNIGSIERAILIQTLSIFQQVATQIRVCHRARQCLWGDQPVAKQLARENVYLTEELKGQPGLRYGRGSEPGL